MFLYMGMYMQCVYAFVHGYVDECGCGFDYRIIWFIELNLIIEIQNQNQKS